MAAAVSYSYAAPPHAVDSPFITFNVAGRLFTTSRDTVVGREPCSRLALIARGVLPAARDSGSGSLHLDRDPKLFQTILNWLRDGWCSLPASPEERRELLQEVRHYQLAGMEAWLAAQEGNSSACDSDAGGGISRSSIAACAYLPASPTPAARGPPAAAAGGGGGYSGRSSACWGIAAAPTLASSPARPVSATYAPGTLLGATTGPASPFRSSFAPGGPSQDPLGAAAAGGCGRLVSSSLVSSSPILAKYAAAAAAVARLPVPNAVAQQECGGQPCSAPLAPPPPPPHFNAAMLSPSIRRLSGSPTHQQADSHQFWDSGDWGMGAKAAAADDLPRRYWATAALSSSAAEPAGSQQGTNSDYKWTSRYLQNNPRMQLVVEALLELACLPPDTSLHGGRVAISISSECTHGGSQPGGGSIMLRERPRLSSISVVSSMGWHFELRPQPFADVSKYDGLVELLLDNWFVLTAVLKDSYSMLLEEDRSSRPGCVACWRSNINLTIQPRT